MIADIDTIDDLSLTTNGILLARHAADLKDAGLSRVNVSLDTLKPERFRQITRCGELEDTLRGIEVAKEIGLTAVKINMVVMAGVNDDELIDFARKTIDDDWNVRFIEHMPVNGEDINVTRLVSVSDMIKQIAPLGIRVHFKV